MKNMFQTNARVISWHMLKKLFAFFAFLLAACSFLSGADFTRIHRMEDSIEELQSADSSCLVIFDVDNVLITSLSAINRPVGDPVRDALRKECHPHSTMEEEIDYLSLGWKQSTFRLTEISVPSMIKELQYRGIPTIALSSLGTGAFGCIPDLTAYRTKQLQDFSIDFSLSAPTGDYIFTELVKVYDSYPTYRNGILLTNWYENTKGSVLMAFLKKISLKPSKVIFFDDSIKNLMSVKEQVEACNIEFIGIHYLCESLLNDQLDIDLAKQQLEYLYRHRVWLEDQAMKETLKVASEN